MSLMTTRIRSDILELGPGCSDVELANSGAALATLGQSGGTAERSGHI